MTKVILTSTDIVSAELSIDKLKKANRDIQISPLDHFNGFFKLLPYLKLYKELNPGFLYKVQKSPETNEFSKLAVLFPYSIRAMKH